MHTLRSLGWLALFTLAVLVAGMPPHQARADDRPAAGRDTCQSRTCGGHGMATLPRKGRYH